MRCLAQYEPWSKQAEGRGAFGENVSSSACGARGLAKGPSDKCDLPLDRMQANYLIHLIGPSGGMQGTSIEGSANSGAKAPTIVTKLATPDKQRTTSTVSAESFHREED